MQSVHRKLVFGGVLISVLSLLLFWSWVPADFSNTNCSFNQNAAWISVDWTSKPIEEDTIRRLAESARSRNMKHIFPYISYLKADGSFSPSYRYASEFVANFRKYNQEVQILAWIGLPLVNPRSIGVHGWVDLSDSDVRKMIVRFIVQQIEQSDFDGVHLNAETVQNNDTDFLLLLDEVRKNMRQDKMISVTGSHWIPESINRLPFIRDFRWTSSYYEQVGKRVDQIAAMTYDSYTFHPLLYRLWMREQVNGISSSLENFGAELLIGISVSQEKTLSHQPVVENLSNGLAGLCAGTSSPTSVQGIAIYADWEFSEADWQVWRAWQRQVKRE